MAYRLYMNDIVTIRNYDNLQKMPPEKRNREKYYYDIATPLRFILNSTVKDHFKIEEIDSLLCCYKNERNFIEELKKHHLSYLTEKERQNNHLTLAYRKDKTTKEATIIFDDLLLFEQATDLRKKKRMSRKGQKVCTDSTERLEDFIHYIKSLAMNPTTKDFLLNPKHLSYLTYDEKEYLDMDVIKGQTKYETDDFGNDKKVIVKPGIRSLLKDYIRLKELYREESKYGQSSSYLENDLRETESEINLFFRTDYRNLREMIEWENRYVTTLKQVLQRGNISSERKEIIKLQIEKVQLEKECRNERRTREIIHYDDEKDIFDALTDINSNKQQFENERINELFQSGGIESVMENMDLDDILSNRNDAEQLGILPKKNK